MIKPTRLTPHIFPAVGRCVYCGAVEGLTLEHVIPKSLSGALLLPQASCMQCAAITAKFEQTCARTIFGPLRSSYGFPTRRPKERPKQFVVETTDASGNTTQVTIPTMDYPKLLFMLQFCRLPGLLSGGLDQDGPAIKPFVIATEPTDFSPHIGQALGKFDAFAFARLVAKIGHCLMSATLKPDQVRPLALEFIMGKSDDLASIAGGLSEIATVEASLHWTRLRDHFCVPTRKRYVVAHVRLFACFGAPTYLAAVGERDWDAPLLGS